MIQFTVRIKGFAMITHVADLNVFLQSTSLVRLKIDKDQTIFLRQLIHMWTELGKEILFLDSGQRKQNAL